MKAYIIFVAFLLCCIVSHASDWVPSFSIRGEYGNWNHSNGSFSLKSEGSIDKKIYIRLYFEIINNDQADSAFETVTINMEHIKILCESLISEKDVLNNEDFSIKRNNNSVILEIIKSRGDDESKVCIVVSKTDAIIVGQRMYELYQLYSSLKLERAP